jgi:hypothetical protein
MAFRKGKSGNPDGTQTNKPFLAALTRAIVQEDAKRLRQAAETVLDLAAAGEPWAVQFLADRTDGKPAQSVTAEVKGEFTVNLPWAKQAIAQRNSV